jgi:nitroimidazol reductase NimA-like FMN-containing flavoprotein (pyridoxamine 5'-phosphate oxidase superfamily)
MLGDDRLVALTEAECLDLLGTADVGRVGVTVDALPAIFPVNYRLVNGDVVFRTGEGLKLRAALDRTVVAFEVDHVDPAQRVGWSVLVVGVAEELGAGERVELDGAITPWAPGDRSHTVRIRPEVMTGRRIADPGPRAHPSPTT